MYIILLFLWEGSCCNQKLIALSVNWPNGQLHILFPHVIIYVSIVILFRDNTSSSILYYGYLLSVLTQRLNYLFSEGLWAVLFTVSLHSLTLLCLGYADDVWVMMWKCRHNVITWQEASSGRATSPKRVPEKED